MDATSNESAVKNRCISLIVYAHDESDQQIWNTVRAVGSAGWRSQVLIVDSNAIDGMTSSERITYRPIPKVFDDLPTALQATKYETVVILDPDFEIKRTDWQWICTRIDSDKVQCFSNSPYKSVQGYKKVLLAVYHLMVWILFRTRKTEFHPGAVLIPKSLVPWYLLNEETSFRSNQRFFETTQLLALSRLNGATLEEFSVGNTVTENVHPVNSRELRRSAGNAIGCWWNQIMYPLDQTQDPSLASRVNPLLRLAGFSLLLLVCVSLIFSNLNYPLIEPDEARNAQLAINVVETGDWMALKLARKSYWDKPPAQIWAIATSYSLFGVSPASTRFPGALATTLSVLFTLILGRRLVGYRAALAGSLLLLLSGGFIFVGRYVTMDASLTCCITVMSLSLFIATKNTIKPKWMIIAGIAAGIGILVKGPVVLVLGLPPVLASLWLTSNPNLFRFVSWLFFLVPAVAIASPWFIATTINDPEFFVYFFWKHHVVRFSEAFNHREPFWYYIPVILILMFPASYLMPSLLRFIGSRRLAERSLRTKTHGFLLLMAIWVVGFFSLSESKLPTYILPALPALCLLMGVVLDKKIIAPGVSGWQNIRDNSNGKRVFLEGIPRRNAIELFAGVIVITLVLKFAFSVNIPWLVIGLGVLMAAVLTWVARQSGTSARIAWSGMAAMAFCFVAVVIHCLSPQIATTRSIHLAAKTLKAERNMQNAPIVFFGRESYGSKIILGDEKVVYFRIAEADAVAKYLKKHPQAILVSGKPQMKNLRRMLDWSVLLETAPSRHLYVSQPNPTLARNKDDQLFR